MLSVERLQIAANDGAIFVLLRGRWRLRRTGAEITASAANVFEFQGGRIRSCTVLNNTAACAEAS